MRSTLQKLLFDLGTKAQKMKTFLFKADGAPETVPLSVRQYWDVVLPWRVVEPPCGACQKSADLPSQFSWFVRGV